MRFLTFRRPGPVLLGLMLSAVVAAVAVPASASASTDASRSSGNCMSTTTLPGRTQSRRSTGMQTGR